MTQRHWLRNSTALYPSQRLLHYWQEVLARNVTASFLISQHGIGDIQATCHGFLSSYTEAIYDPNSMKWLCA